MTRNHVVLVQHVLTTIVVIHVFVIKDILGLLVKKSLIIVKPTTIVLMVDLVLMVLIVSLANVQMDLVELGMLLCLQLIFPPFPLSISQLN